jgi:GH25 family lysozyme M1 (1,4-beta-N-acetylmuramidase)
MNIHQLKQWLGNNLWHGEQGAKREIESELALTALVMPDMSKVWGVDVSHWNPAPVDFQRMKDLYHLDFAIIKGADGTITARYFRENVAAAKAAGIPWGMYVWLYPNNKISIAAQVSAWRALEVELVPPLGVFIDCEWTTYNGAAANPVASDLRLAHDKYFALSQSPATTYTAKGYADTYLKGFDWSREPLWAADYNYYPPRLPIGATTFEFGQFTSTLDGWALDPTGNQKLDGNYWHGNHNEFAAKYGTVNPPTGDPMYKYTATALADETRLRPAPNVNQTYTGSYPDGTQFFGDVKYIASDPLALNSFKGDVWIEVKEIRPPLSAPIVKAGWVAVVHRSSPVCSLVENAPVPTTDTQISMTLKADGSIVGTWKKI